MNETLTSDAAARRDERGGGDRSQFPLQLPVWAWLCIWLVVWVGGSVIAHYAIWDPSYADRKSFGFAADVGNGFVTLVPSLILFFGITFPILPPVVLGLIGAFIFYQKFYCTTLYFFTYLFNRR